MKTKNLFLAAIMLLSFGCADNEDLSKDDDAANTEVSENQDISLVGTKWQLTAFVNDSEGTTKTPMLLDKPSKYGHYWIQFNEDNTCEGRSIANLLLGRYSAGSVSSEIQITVGAATEVMELSPDGEEFIEKLNRVHSLGIKDSSLMLYYNETDYLLLKIYDNEKE
jgi:hypothetical protein